jgi:hypothetical protein
MNILYKTKKAMFFRLAENGEVKNHVLFHNKPLDSENYIVDTFWFNSPSGSMNLKYIQEYLLTEARTLKEAKELHPDIFV